MRRFVSLLAFIGCLCLAPIGAIAQDYRDLLQSFRAETLTYDDKRFLQTALASTATITVSLTGIGDHEVSGLWKATHKPNLARQRKNGI
jgi:hypothetical protein